MSGSSSKYLPTNVCIYAVVDVSGSMKGSKIRSVCSSIREMFGSWPDSVLFDVTLFSTTTQKIVTALKSKINIQDIIKKIEESCAFGGNTALYDAWGDMLTSIPDSVFVKEEVQIFVLTDGDDNASGRFTLSSVLALTKQRVTNRAQFTLIRVGDVNTQLIQSINSIGSKQIQTLSVENNAFGIETALQSVNKNILTSIRSTQSAQSNAIKNRLLSTPPTYPSSSGLANQHPMLTTIKKAPTTSKASPTAHMSTPASFTTSKKDSSSTATNQSSRPNDTNVSYVLK